VNISVALCTYNGAPYILSQLDSIARQTVVPDEVVICDDGSTDGTTGLIEKFALSAPFPVRLYRNEQNLKTTKNFEKALSLCTGGIIFLSDQDDIWLPRKVEVMTACFTNNPRHQVIFSDGYIINEAGETVHSLWQHLRFSPEERNQWKNGNAFACLLHQGNCVMGAAMAVRKSFLPAALPFDTLHYWIHDGIIALKAAMNHSIGFVEDKLIQYRQHSGQQVGIRKEKGILAVFLHKATTLQWIKSDEHLEAALSDMRHIHYWAGLTGDTKNSELTGEKLRHLEKREFLIHKSIRAKLLPVLREWVKGNYRKYSAGRFAQSWVLVVKDLLGRRTEGVS
jgi:glycosyltransferase involved in cell wall biosynthesis